MSLLGRKSTAKKTHTRGSVGLFSVEGLFPLYLAVISLVSIIVLCVNIGILTSSIGNYILITDKEYVLSDRAWEVRQCSEPEWKSDESVEKSPGEIALCEEKAKKMVIAQRSIELKETFIDALSWSLVFGLLFFFHYPKFLASKN